MTARSQEHPKVWRCGRNGFGVRSTVLGVREHCIPNWRCKSNVNKDMIPYTSEAMICSRRTVFGGTGAPYFLEVQGQRK